MRDNFPFYEKHYEVGTAMKRRFIERTAPLEKQKAGRAQPEFIYLVITVQTRR